MMTPTYFRTLILPIACALGMTASNTCWAATVDVAGVKFEDVIDQRGSKLVLNGAGVRYKAVFKVYSAGLYLPKKVNTTEDALSLSGHKRISLTMLREIDANPADWRLKDALLGKAS